MYCKQQPESIQELFDDIAPNYDRANFWLSLGMHEQWNSRLVKAVHGANHLLDLCAGTGEIGCSFLIKNPSSQATLLDFSSQMLKVAEKKTEIYRERVELVKADAQEIPLPDCAVDAVTIAYGIRNVREPARCFKEIYRLLQPGGRCAILELTRPKSSLLSALHKGYTRAFLPLIGKVLAKNKEAYAYLFESVQHFSSPELLKKELLAAHFQCVELTPLLGGVTTLIECVK